MQSPTDQSKTEIEHLKLKSAETKKGNPLGLLIDERQHRIYLIARLKVQREEIAGKPRRRGSYKSAGELDIGLRFNGGCCNHDSGRVSGSRSREKRGESEGIGQGYLGFRPDQKSSGRTAPVNFEKGCWISFLQLKNGLLCFWAKLHFSTIFLIVFHFINLQILFFI